MEIHYLEKSNRYLRFELHVLFNYEYMYSTSEEKGKWVTSLIVRDKDKLTQLGIRVQCVIIKTIFRIIKYTYKVLDFTKCSG